jgi:hypothetical protein
MPFIDPDHSGITFLKIFAIEFIAIAIVFGLLSVF